MADIFESGDDLINKEEVTNSSDVALYEKKSSFKPWHKPRKQWVRDKQWWFHLNKLLIENKVKYSDIESLKYFGLPGGDLLDVEYIRKNLESSTEHNNKNILLHGFFSNKNDKLSAESRLAELLDSPNFDGASKVEFQNFGSLTINDSLGWKNVKAMGPYHFINLDFCDCVFKDETLESIHKLMNFQFTRQLDVPWLFCITTRVDREGVNQKLIERLDEVLSNLHSNAEVLQSIKDCFDAACEAIEKKLKLNSAEIEEHAFSELLQVCFILWTVAYSLEHNTKVFLSSSMKYTVNGGSSFPDMLSLVFLFQKIESVVPDPSGLVSTLEVTPVISVTNQLELKLKAIIKLSRSLDVDEHLFANSGIFKECVDESKRLLSQCGWNVTNYEKDVC